MTALEMLSGASDFWRRNQYALKEYVIFDGKKHPFALICPGGGYGMVCSFIEGEPYAKALNARGYSAFVVYYRVKKRARYPSPQQDVARALGDILSRADTLKLETSGYSLWGSSAGGHLAASFGTKTMGYAKYGLPRPGVLVLTYPVITMGLHTHIGSRKNLLGETPDFEQIRLTSVEKQVTADYPPPFIWCGMDDHTVEPINSRMLADALASNGVPHLFRQYPGVDHGVGLGRALACESWFSEAVEFWEQQCFRDGSEKNDC